MNKQPTPHKAKPSPTKRRIPPKIRHAIDMYTTQGMSKADAAKRAGVTPGHLYNYEMRPHVKEYAEQKKAEYIQDVEAMRAPYKAQAFEVARDLMHNAASENVRMRAVEFLAGERKESAVNVQINNTIGAPQGYEFVPPNAQLVDITPAPETEE